MNSKLLIPQTPELIEFRAVTFMLDSSKKKEPVAFPVFVTQKFVVVAA